MARAVRSRGRRGGMPSLEFAFVVPLLMLTLVGAMEMTIQAAVSLLLDGALREAARFGVTGSAEPAQLAGAAPKDRPEAIRRLIVQRGAGMLTDQKLTISVTAAPTIGAIGATKAGQQPGADPAGAASEYVLYTVSYVQPLITPLVQAAFGRIAFTHTARALVRNEPFPKAS